MIDPGTHPNTGKKRYSHSITHAQDYFFLNVTTIQSPTRVHPPHLSNPYLQNLNSRSIPCSLNDTESFFACALLLNACFISTSKI